MGTYEMDDGDLNYLLEVLSKRDTPQALELRQRLVSQQPIPVPVKIGAMVVTYIPVIGSRTFLRWAFESATHQPWIEVGDIDHSYRTEDIGQITEVLSPGLDV